MDDTSKIGIIGLGYVGTPLAYLVASKKYKVIGIDNNDDRVEAINKRKDIPNELKDKCEKLDLKASNDYSLLQYANIIIVCVPTPTINNKPDLTIFESAISNMSCFIKKGDLVIIESTIGPGTTRNYVEKYLKEKANLTINKDYDLAYCPERIDPGNPRYWVKNINRICGASSEKALKRACEFYKTVIDGKIIPMESIEEAELVKVWENSMRNISIAEANLLALVCDKYGFSIKKVMEGLENKIEQFGISLSYPGLGPGGHCIPEDIHYLIDSAEKNINVDMTLLKEAVKINENMPKYVFKKMLNVINKNGDNIDNLNILMLGKSYKPNSRDTRHSQATKLYNIIQCNSKSEIIIFDPIAENITSKIKIKKTLEENLKKADVVILSCPHNIFLNVDYIKYKNIKYIVDCWNKLDKNEIINKKIIYIGVGE